MILGWSVLNNSLMRGVQKYRIISGSSSYIGMECSMLKAQFQVGGTESLRLPDSPIVGCVSKVGAN